MRSSSNKIYISSGSPVTGPSGILGRLVALILGIMVFGVAIFVGAIFLAAFVGLVLIGALIFGARVWWMRRKMERYEQEHGDLEAEYRVLDDDQK